VVSIYPGEFGYLYKPYFTYFSRFLFPAKKSRFLKRLEGADFLGNCDSSVNGINGLKIHDNFVKNGSN